MISEVEKREQEEAMRFLLLHNQ